ncbi:hypothetical protein [Parapedobacter sp. 10938]|nr:hypothetical protein [Parapedobacter sp. 10938]MEC3881848.1 hypothetical protein [Parapedobacter sp. 10938]
MDAAIVGGADYIVTNDAHFNTLKKVEFSKIDIISIDRFMTMID